MLFPWTNCTKQMIKCRQMYGLCVRRLSPRTPYSCDRIRNPSTTHSLEPRWGILPESWLAITRPAYPMHTVLDHHPHSRLRNPMEGSPPPTADLYWTQAPLHCCTALGICVPILFPSISGCTFPVVPNWGLFFLTRLVRAPGSGLLGEEKVCDSQGCAVAHFRRNTKTSCPSLFGARCLRYM